jgi:viroplasmin and RNaseH domain-containing protein
LVHVLYVSHPSALQGTTEYARDLVERFFRKYTHIDVSQIASHTHKFCNLASNSRLEIVFEGRLKGFQSPNYKVYKYEYSQGLVVIFEVEVRSVKRYIPPNSDYDSLEIERTDFLPQYWDVSGRGRDTGIYENTN